MRCQICRRTVAQPGKASEVLTEHYRRAHPKELGLPAAGRRGLDARRAGPGGAQAGPGGRAHAHLGYENHEQAAGRGAGNARNGTIAKTMQTGVGPVPVAVPGTGKGTSRPLLVAKRAAGVVVTAVLAPGRLAGPPGLLEKLAAAACPQFRGGDLVFDLRDRTLGVRRG